MLFGSHQVLINRHDNDTLWRAMVLLKPNDFLAKLVTFAQQDAIEGIQPQQQ